jgi:hypothetical protein
MGIKNERERIERPLRCNGAPLPPTLVLAERLKENELENLLREAAGIDTGLSGKTDAQPVREGWVCGRDLRHGGARHGELHSSI